MERLTRFLALSVILGAVAYGALVWLDRSVRRDLRERGDVPVERVPSPLRITVGEARAVLDAVTAALEGLSLDLRDLPPRLARDLRPRRAFVTVGGPDRATSLASASAPGLVAAVERCLERLRRPEGEGPAAGSSIPDARAPERPRPEAPWIKLDVVEELFPAREHPLVEPLAIDRSLAGLELDPPGGPALLAEELWGAGLCDQEGRLRRDEIPLYVARARPHGPRADLQRARVPLRRFRCASFFRDARGETFALYRGSRDPEIVRRDGLLAAARDAGRYLARSLDERGRLAARERSDAATITERADLVRQAAALTSMYRLYGVTADDELLLGADRARAFLEEHLVVLDDRDERTGLVRGGEIKLGAVALFALALVERIEATGEREDLVLARSLGRTILSMQRGSGGFVSVVRHPSGEPRGVVSSVYPGQALGALVRLHGLDGDARWLEAAERASLAMPAEGGVVPDPWRLAALDRLHRERAHPRHLAYASRVAGAILEAQSRDPLEPDLLGSFGVRAGSTRAAASTQALVAAYRLLRDHGRSREVEPILEGICLAVLFQLRTRYGPESALYATRPGSVLGAFRVAPGSGEIRLEAVHHNLRALLAVYEVLREERRDGIGRRGPLPVVDPLHRDSR